MNHFLELAAVQLNSGDRVNENLRAISRATEQAAAQGARLVLLPENALFMGRREADKLALAEPYADGPLQLALADLARRLGIFLVCGSLPLSLPGIAGKVSASCVVFGPDGTALARYDKRHLFDVSLSDGTAYRESKHYRAGENPPQWFDCDGTRVGLSICYDLRFPEHYRGLVAQGAELMLVPAAFTWPTGQAHWDVLLRARAIENQAAVLAANQCGEHPNGQRSWGHSKIIGPWGETLAETGEQASVIRARLDLDQLARRRQEFPALRHRRDAPTTDEAR